MITPYPLLQGESDNHQSEFACIYEEGGCLVSGDTDDRSAINRSVFSDDGQKMKM